MSGKRVILYGILLGVMLLIVLCGIGVMWVERDRAQPTPAGKEVTFVVGEFDGRLAVFEQGNPQPVEWYEEVWISSFPKEEQRRLKVGITANTSAELAAVLEDYTA